MGKQETDHIYPSELNQFEEGVGMGFIELGTSIMSISQIMIF